MKRFVKAFENTGSKYTGLNEIETSINKYAEEYDLTIVQVSYFVVNANNGKREALVVFEKWKEKRRNKIYRIKTVEKSSDNAHRMATNLVENKLACSINIREVDQVYGQEDEIHIGKGYELNILTRKRDEVIKKINELRLYGSPDILIETIEATPETVD